MFGKNRRVKYYDDIGYRQGTPSEADMPPETVDYLENRAKENDSRTDWGKDYKGALSVAVDALSKVLDTVDEEYYISPDTLRTVRRALAVAEKELA